MQTNQTPNGLEADYWTDPEIDGTPEHVTELLEIPGVDAVKKITHGVYAVDTQIWWSEDGYAEPNPELLNRITAADGMSLGGWSIQQVTVKKDGSETMLRIQVGALTPGCRAQGCYNPATHEIHNVLLDGTKFDVYACDEH